MPDPGALRILMVNLPFSGHTNPTLGLARGLREAGCLVDYVHAPQWRQRVEATGARFIPYDDYPAGHCRTETEFRSWAAAYDTVKRIGATYDCLVYEMLFLPGKALADQLGIPSFRVFSTFALDAGILEELGATGGPYLTAIFRFPRACAALSRRLQRRFDLRYPDIARELTDNSPALNFTYTVRDFQPHDERFDPDRYAFVGSASADRIEEEFHFPEGQDPIIYISLGTLVGLSMRLFRTLIRAFDGQAVRVIGSLSAISKPEKLGTIPANVSLHSFVPQIRVLERASLFITHGGMNSVNESIACGTPMLVLPAGNDQPLVARQVERLHLGLTTRRRGVTEARIRTMAMSILQDPGYTDAVRRLQRRQNRAGGNQEIVRQITQALRTPPPTP